MHKQEINSPLTVCITGVTSPIGRHILNFFENSNFVVRVLSRKSLSITQNNVYLYQGDISDTIILKAFLMDCNFLFHCAGETRNEELMYPVNVFGMKNIIDICKSLTDLHYFCFISSAGVIGHTEDVFITEDSPCNPSNIYEKSKFDSEQIILKSKLNCSIKILRPVNVVSHEKLGIIHGLFNLTFKSYLRLFILGQENCHIIHANSVAMAAIHFMSHLDNKDNIFFVSADFDKNNNYKKIWALVHKSFLIITLPRFMTQVIRKVVLNGNNINIEYSSHKLLETGFKDIMTVNETVNLIKKARSY